MKIMEDSKKCKNKRMETYLVRYAKEYVSGQRICQWLNFMTEFQLAAGFFQKFKNSSGFLSDRVLASLENEHENCPKVSNVSLCKKEQALHSAW